MTQSLVSASAVGESTKTELNLASNQLDRLKTISVIISGQNGVPGVSNCMIEGQPLSAKTSDVRAHPELFFGVVGATGTNLNAIRASLRNELEPLGIKMESVHLSDLLLQWGKQKPPARKLDRTELCMNLGDKMREEVVLGGAVLLGVQRIRELRATALRVTPVKNPKRAPVPGIAYVFHSLKHPAEVSVLRSIYGQNFYLISVYSDEDKRKANLLKDSSEHDPEFNEGKTKSTIERLLNRDLAAPDDHGQQVQKVFPLADLFLNGDDEKDYTNTIGRFVRLIFNDVLLTPTKDEYFMFYAHAAARRSADLGRQVGACIATEAGDLVTVGCNDVPRAGGGQYWCTDPEDGRDCNLDEDVNEARQRKLLTDLLVKLEAGGKLKISKDDIESFVAKAFNKEETAHPDAQILKNAELFNLIGYYRAVHAETASLLEAARLGHSVNHCKLYVTAFPCHECARHIVCAGVSTVLYVEPYPKSLASEHYPDSIEFASTELATNSSGNRKVIFRPFTGVAPRLYFRLFSAEKGSRKLPDGKVKKWKPESASLRYVESPISYILKETQNLEKFKKILDQSQKE
jgi:cytidine deaminase